MPKLRAGDKVAIVAPSAKIGGKAEIENALNYIKELGLEPVLGKHLLEQRRYMAGTDKDRAEDINTAFADQEIKALFCVRAAAGATRILPLIDYEVARENPKPVIGFCDNAALQVALLKKANIVSYNGFVFTYDCKNGNLDTKIRSSLENLLQGKKIKIISGATKRKGKAKGELIAVNLSVLLYLAGTPYFPDLRGKILLIEDVHERMHKIDLMLQQLKQQPHFAELAGVIFGQFTDCSGDDEDGTLDDCIDDFLQGTDFPVIHNFDFGHTPSRYVLPLGSQVSLDADNASLEVLSY